MKRLFVFCIALLSGIFISAQSIKKIKITDLEKTMTESKTPLIISFWATWCVPCVEEIPYFQEEVKKHNATLESTDSIVLLLVSLDMEEQYPAALSSFIKKRKFTASVAWLDETNADYFCPKVDTKWSGAIPATLFLNNKKEYRNFFEGQLSSEKFKKEIMAML
ncbi:MAG TPA: thioredoxin domain-containing protein [Chitinophagaceae bacterium]